MHKYVHLQTSFLQHLRQKKKKKIKCFDFNLFKVQPCWFLALYKQRAEKGWLLMHDLMLYPQILPASFTTSLILNSDTDCWAQQQQKWQHSRSCCRDFQSSVFNKNGMRNRAKNYGVSTFCLFCQQWF